MARKTVIVTNKISFTSPPNILRSIATYKLKIITEHKFEEKGAYKEVKVDELELTFNKNDHPKVYDYCLHVIHERIENSRDLAQTIYPNARIIQTTLKLPSALKALDN